ncbi:hypothetical protein [Pedobacter sp. MW01-1-1]|uniref:hypothetical protein n=1 Tax=Pedobacter sp. MW01-1-1 TaxID=3383027 RepID=UPI003FEF9C0A
MRKNAPLPFDQLAKEFELIDSTETIKGGLFVTNPYSNTSVFQVDEQSGTVVLLSAPPGLVWNPDLLVFDFPSNVDTSSYFIAENDPIYKTENGRSYISWDNGATWENSLDEVKITASYNTGSMDDFFTQALSGGYLAYLENYYYHLYQNQNGGGSSGGGGGGSTGGSGSGSGGNNATGQLQQISLNPNNTNESFTQNLIYQAISWADATTGLAFSASEASALYMGTTMPGWFSAASNGMAWIGVVDNVAQFIDDPNWTDATQVVIGSALILVAGPEVILIGSAGLFIWELVE